MIVGFFSYSSLKGSVWGYAHNVARAQNMIGNIM